MPPASNTFAFCRAAAACCAGLLLGATAEQAFACPFAPPAVHDLELARFYTDGAGSTTSPALLDQHKRDTAPVRTFLKTMTGEADASFIQPTGSLGLYRAKCAVEWLEVWARGEALLGRVVEKQAAAERRWTLAGAALAYLKVKPAATPAQAQVIEQWLTKLALAAETDFQNGKLKHNNHYYWLGLGLAATSLATGDAARWEKARAIMKDAADGIAANGTLPLELARQARALHYHAFALMPLTAMAELARSKGEDWYAFGDGALDRLVAITARGIEAPELFEQLSGYAQERPVDPQYGWLQLYGLERPSALAGVEFEIPSDHMWLGGNVLLLNHALTKPKS